MSIDARQAYRKWIDGAGTLEVYFKTTPFISAEMLGSTDLEKLPCVKHSYDLDKISSVIKDNANELYLFDVNGAEGIELAVELQNGLSIKCILQYNMIFHNYGLVGDEKYLKALIEGAKKIKKQKFNKYGFVLDINRYKNDLDYDPIHVFNNQYEITEEDMPDLRYLNINNINKVILFHDGSIKEDINCYLDYLKSNEIFIETYQL